VHVFGLTGGIACGKSTVANRWRARGLPVVDADQVAREVVLPGSEGLAEIVRVFGPTVLLPDGSLDRKALARIAFATAEARKELERITHPRIGLRTAELMSELARAGEPLACYEAALLVENHLADRFRPLVVCACSEATQLARIQARDKVSAEDALARVRAQTPLREKVAAANFVIETDGRVEESAQQADRVLRTICETVGADAHRYEGR
jgi:dephospho-CoA kinase